MRKLILALPLVALLGGCSTFTWQGQGSGVSESAAARGVKDVAELTRRYETERFWNGVRQVRDGRVNAFGRDLASITSTIDRHLFNYSPMDPAVNYPTDLTVFDHVGRMGVGVIAR